MNFQTRAKTLGPMLLSLIFLFTVCTTIVFTFIQAPIPLFIVRQFMELGLETIIFLIIGFTLLIQLKGRTGNVILLIATCSLFFMSLIHKWQTADNYFLLGGFFPQSDSLSYYSDAQKLIYGFQMTDAGAYRPLYSTFLAGLLLATDSNLQWVVIILSSLNAIAVFLATLEIRNILNSNFAAATYLVITYMFFRRFSGTLMTENLGFCLGNLALIFLIRGAFQSSLTKVLFGIFLLTLGLNARAGAFLILPVLIIWVWFFFRQSQHPWRPITLAAFTIFLGFGVNFVVSRLTISDGAQVFSNYSFTLYGLASGNKGWEQASIDYPGASTEEIYNFAIQKIIDQPSLFFVGILGAYQDFFKSDNGAFSFLLLKHDRGDLTNIILWLLTIFGLIHAYFQPNKKHLGISVAFFLGIFISISLLPPADSVRMRAQAATIPLSLYVITVGLTVPQYILSRRKGSPQTEETSSFVDPPGHSAIISVMILAVCTLPALWPVVRESAISTDKILCKGNEQAHVVEVREGNSIQLVSTSFETMLPFLSHKQFTNKIVRPEQQIEEQDKSFFITLPPGTVITISQSLLQPSIVATNKTIFLITEGFPKPGTFNICLIPSRVSGFFTISDTAPISVFEQSPNTPQQWAIYLQVITISLIFLLALANFSGVTLTIFWRQPTQVISMLLLVFSIIFILHQVGILSLFTESQIIPSDSIRHSGDTFLYTADIGTNKISDSKLFNFNVKLYEDEILLGPQHETQSLIDAYGGGGYILKDDFLFFSSSDNTDPRTNGRQYIIQWATRIRLRYHFLAYMALMIGLALRFKKQISPMFTISNKLTLRKP